VISERKNSSGWSETSVSVSDVAIGSLFKASAIIFVSLLMCVYLF
jgi:hypothetical protein